MIMNMANTRSGVSYVNLAVRMVLSDKTHVVLAVAIGILDRILAYLTSCFSFILSLISTCHMMLCRTLYFLSLHLP